MTIFETKLISAGLCFFIFMMGGRVKRYTGFHPRIGISPIFLGCFSGEAMLNFREGGIPLSKSLKKKEGLNHLNLFLVGKLGKPGNGGKLYDLFGTPRPPGVNLATNGNQ